MERMFAACHEEREREGAEMSRLPHADEESDGTRRMRRLQRKDC